MSGSAGPGPVGGSGSSPSVWRAGTTDPEVWFSADELERSRSYQRPLARLRLMRNGLGLAGVAGVALTGGGDRLIDLVGADGWIAQVVVMVVGLQVLALLWDPALDWWVDLVHDRRWGISTQTPGGFFADQVKSLVLTTTVATVLAVAVYGLIRSTGLWWIWAWLVVSVGSVVFGFLFPVLIAPIFNRFTPLPDGELSQRVDELAAGAGVELDGAWVADASRRSTRDNAYVAGLGRTRRMVLYDTILDHPVEVIAQVVAHELGHWRLRHLRAQIPLSAALTLLIFGWLRLVAGWEGLWSWFGTDGVADPAAMPILLVAVQPAAAVAGLIGSWVSRAFERQADRDALDQLGDPATMLAMQRRLHTKNLADLDPGWWTRVRASHPPAAERMAFTSAWAASGGIRG